MADNYWKVREAIRRKAIEDARAGKYDNAYKREDFRVAYDLNHRWQLARQLEEATR